MRAQNGRVFKVCTFSNFSGMEEEEGFKVTLESLYSKKIKEISYDEEESYQE